MHSMLGYQTLPSSGLLTLGSFCKLCHGQPVTPSLSFFLLCKGLSRISCLPGSTRVCVCGGHTHVPQLFPASEGF